jgi:hypothetical protein
MSVLQRIGGLARKLAGSIAPANEGLAAEARLRGTTVKLAAAAPSGGVTTAMT